MTADLTDENQYDHRRLRQWIAGQADGRGLSRRHILQISAAAAAATLPALGDTPAAAAAQAGPIVKPLPPELFNTFGTNAEMRWEAMSGQGYLTPIDRFFVRNHTSTPVIDATTWRLQLFGSGLQGNPSAESPFEISYSRLRRLPSVTYEAAIECAGNGRSFYTTQQSQTVSGTAWKLGAIGVARWRGVRLSTVLKLAGLRHDAVDVLPEGLDSEWTTGGVNLGHIRRPLPIAKALKDVVLAYEMNGEPLPPDHGHPVRLVVPGWIGISSIKWLGRIEVSTTPLFSPWNTQFYRLFGPSHPADGELVSRQTVKSAFELPWPATLTTDRQRLYGRSWSGNGAIRTIEVSTDGGTTWRHATRIGRSDAHGWQRWRISWRPPSAGEYALRARATDTTGVRQPDQTPHNTLGYLFDAVVVHPVTVTG